MKYIVGIDEVGRGPIAGPVAVCAFICKSNFFDSLEIKVPLRDSKKLTKKQREKWFQYLKECKEKELCDFAVSMVSAEWIDKVGIVRSIQKALNQSLFKLEPNGSTLIFLDGGLRAPEQFVHQKTVTDGDNIYPVISCASIVAKVSRDRIMYNYAKEYKEYGFENHVGYGTRAHYRALKKNGLTPLHRKTFL